MQTQCPVCDAVIPCDDDALGSSLKCQHCAVSFTAVSAPTEQDLQRQADRKVLIYEYVLPIVSVIVLGSATAAAFFWSHRLQQNAASNALANAESPGSNTTPERNAAGPPVAAAGRSTPQQPAPESATDVGGAMQPPSRPDVTAAAAENSASEPDVPVPLPEVVQPESEGSHTTRQTVDTLPAADADSPGSERPRDEYVPQAASVWFRFDGNGWLLSSDSFPLFGRPDGQTDWTGPLLPTEAQPVLTNVSHGRAAFCAAMDETGVLWVCNESGTITQRLKLHDARPTGMVARRKTDDVISCGLDGRLRATTLRGAANSTIIELPAPAFCLTVSDTESTIVVGCADRSIVACGERMTDPVVIARAGVPIRAMDVSGVSRIVVVADDRTVEVHRGRDAQRRWRRTVPVDAITSVAISPNAKCVAVGSDDGAVLLFDAETGGFLHDVQADSAVRSLHLIDDAGQLVMVTQQGLEQRQPPYRIGIPDVNTVQRASDATAETTDPAAVEPRIRFLQRQARYAPLGITSVTVDGDDVRIGGHGLSRAKQVLAFRPTERIFRPRHEVISDELLTFSLPRRVATGSLIAVEFDEGIAVAVPTRLQPPASPGAESPVDISHLFLSDTDTIEIQEAPFTTLTLLDRSSVTDGLAGNGLVICTEDTTLPKTASGNLRFIRTDHQSPPVNLLSEVEEADLSYPSVFVCPVASGIPLPE